MPTEQLPGGARDELENPEIDVWFSAVNVWEIAIEASPARPGFTMDRGTPS